MYSQFASTLGSFSVHCPFSLCFWPSLAAASELLSQQINAAAVDHYHAIDTTSRTNMQEKKDGLHCLLDFRSSLHQLTPPSYIVEAFQLRRISSMHHPFPRVWPSVCFGFSSSAFSSRLSVVVTISPSFTVSCLFVQFALDSDFSCFSSVIWCGDLFEPRMLQSLMCSNTFCWVVDKYFLQKIKEVPRKGIVLRNNFLAKY